VANIARSGEVNACLVSSLRLPPARRLRTLRTGLHVEAPVGRVSWSCPRFPVWEGATERGFVETVFVNGRSLVRATSAGLAFLKEKETAGYENLRHYLDSTPAIGC